MTEFKNNWTMWFHNNRDNWDLNTFKKIVDVNEPETFWRLYNNFDKIGGITKRHYYLLKNGITPIWQDKANCLGGCWSYKVPEEQAEQLWTDLSVYLVNSLLCPKISDEINGISLCLKKNSSVVIKIWNSNSKNNSLKLINEEILKKWGINIIYMSHMS